MEETINQRVKFLLKSQGISENSAASSLGIKQSTLNSAINAKSDNLSSKIIAGLLKLIPELNINWLLTGEGEMINRPDQISQVTLGDFSPASNSGNISINAPDPRLAEENNDLRRQIADLNARLIEAQSKIISLMEKLNQ